MEKSDGEGLQTLAIVLLLCGSLKLLHMLGLISTEGETHTTTKLKCLDAWSQVFDALWELCVVKCVYLTE